MACSVVVTDSFSNDRRASVAYIAANLASPKAARKFDAKIEGQVDRLRAFPDLYSASIHPALAGKDVRVCPVGNYRILYRIHGNTVVLLRLVYKSRNPSQLDF